METPSNRESSNRESGDSLPLPRELVALIELGVWPQAADEQVSVIPTALVRTIAPDQKAIHPIAPPFETVAGELIHNREFWQEQGALDEIDPARALMICDFQLGSESVIVLDYRRPGDPPVLRLEWSDDGKTHWVECARNFADFAAKLGLTKDAPRYDARVAEHRAELERRWHQEQRRGRVARILGWSAAAAIALGVAALAWRLWPR